ncbi:MAG: response regulator [bacterium]|nr:response regulator [bacterium]
MDKIYIICVDDQPEVLNSVLEDIGSLEEKFFIEGCESAEEAEELMQEIDAKGNLVGLVISDHVMPNKNGVEFLTDVKESDMYPNLKKILLTGLATHEDTIRAINKAEIDYYFAKPWEKHDLLLKVKHLMTAFILDTGLDYQDYMIYMDQQLLYRRLKERV